ncbi:hypothetical protein ACH41E_30205 [Streptomyces sp. NPDC020412]|uniref:hypothetical protein n=1 Tax=Streptomyces sp. NPDC020412 TaxID=3365073 RepID=UPI0037A4ED2B
MNDQHAIKWLRPEFQGREHELINFTAAAKLVGVSRSAVSNWVLRHDDFPEVALLTGTDQRPTKFLPRNEFLSFARRQLSKTHSPGRTDQARRPAVQRRADDIAYADRQIIRLRDLEKRQAAALAKTREALKKHEARLETARRLLTAEISAVRALDEAVPNGEETD